MSVNDVNEMFFGSESVGGEKSPPSGSRARKRKTSQAQLDGLKKARKARWPNGKADDGAADILDAITNEKGGDEMPTKTVAKEKIYHLLPKVTSEIGAIRKEQQNSHQRYRYRGIDDALNQISPVLAKHGICTEINVTDHQVNRIEGGKTVYHATLMVQVAFVAPDGSRVHAQAAGEGISHGDDKATAKAMSGAMKYALYFGLMVPVDGYELEDADRNEPAESDVNPAILQAQTMIQQSEDKGKLEGLLQRIQKSDVFSVEEKSSLEKMVSTKSMEFELGAE